MDSKLLSQDPESRASNDKIPNIVNGSSFPLEVEATKSSSEEAMNVTNGQTRVLICIAINIRKMKAIEHEFVAHIKKKPYCTDHK